MYDLTNSVTITFLYHIYNTERSHSFATVLNIEKCLGG